jgi:hypothetical protein
MRKKRIVLICAVLTMAAVHSCSFQLPSSVDVKGKTRLDLSLNPDVANLGNVLAKNIKKTLKSNDKISVLDCYEKRNDDAIMTFLVNYSIILDRDDDFSEPDDNTGESPSDTYPSISIGSYPGKDDDTINLSGLDNYLNGFDIEGIEAYVYVSGGSFILFDDSGPDVEIQMTYFLTKESKPENSSTWKDRGRKIQTGLPDCELQSGEYYGDFPPRGKNLGKKPEQLWPGELDFILNKHPFKLQFDYVVKADIFYPGDNNPSYVPLKLDILLKIPLILTANTDGASISFTEDDPNEEPKDIFSRKDGDDSPLEWIKSCNLRIDLTTPVFHGGTLYLNDGTVLIEKVLSGQTMTLSMSGSDLDYINKTKPYNPKMGIRFRKYKYIEIPWRLRSSGIEFDADIDAKFDI